MELDNILQDLGEFGRFQAMVYVLLSIIMYLVAANNLAYIFIAEDPKYRCFIEDCDELNTHAFEAKWIHYAIPRTKNGKLANCLMYEIIRNNTLSTKEKCISFSNNKEITCKKWVFEEKTLVEQLSIPCIQNQWKLSLVGTIHFVGIIIGSALCGYLADRLGRKRILVVCISVMCLPACLRTCTTSYALFMTLTFVSAIGTSGIYPITLSMSLEIIGRSKRELAWMGMTCFYALGQSSIGLIAYLTTDWRAMQLIISLPPLLCLSYYFILPESILWLVAKRKAEKAQKVLIKMAKFNNKQELHSEITEYFESLKEEQTQIQFNRVTRRFANIRLFFSHSKLVIRFCVLYTIWIVSSMVYYGLSNNSVNLNGNKYLNFELTSLVEMPGTFFGYVTINVIGRRWSLFISLLLCGITCGVCLLLPQNLVWSHITLFLLGKIGITSSFYIMFIWTAELLPTVLRAAGIGLGSTMSGIGATFASFVPLLSKYLSALPIILFSALPLICSFAVFYIPDTFHKTLPESVNDALLL